MRSSSSRSCWRRVAPLTKVEAIRSASISGVIGHLTQVTIDFFRQRAFAAFEPRIQFHYFAGKRVGLDGRFGARLEGLDARNREGGFLLEIMNEPGESLAR